MVISNYFEHILLNNVAIFNLRNFEVEFCIGFAREKRLSFYKKEMVFRSDKETQNNKKSD